MKILITGSSRGIGRALADHLSQQGHLVTGCSRTPPKGNVTWRHITTDLSVESQVRGLFSKLRQLDGSLDALVNNAGVSRMVPFLLTPEEETKRLFELNVFSVFRCVREAVKLMNKSTYSAPSILNITSVASLFSLEGHVAYAASKAAIEQSTRTMAREFAGLNIRVNALGLPPIRTAMTRTLERELVDGLIARQAINRMCEMEDVFGPAEFLLSSQSRFVTGEILYLGGVR